MLFLYDALVEKPVRGPSANPSTIRNPGRFLTRPDFPLALQEGSSIRAWPRAPSPHRPTRVSGRFGERTAVDLETAEAPERSRQRRRGGSQGNLRDSRHRASPVPKTQLSFLRQTKRGCRTWMRLWRKFLAWVSILTEQKTLDLSPHHVAQAEMQVDSRRRRCHGRFPETYRWLLMPT
jgi:hypothetical protein